jgi:hypothetical protein
VTKGEEIIQFPPKRLSEKEKSKVYASREIDSLIQLLQGNPLFERLDSERVSFPPAKPAKEKKSSTASQPPQTTVVHPVPTTTSVNPLSFSSSRSAFAPAAPAASSAPSISLAGAAMRSIIMSNLSPTVSVQDVSSALTGMGGGVKEISLFNQPNRGPISAKITFFNPAEGGRECIERYNGVMADGLLFHRFSYVRTRAIH